MKIKPLYITFDQAKKLRKLGADLDGHYSSHTGSTMYYHKYSRSNKEKLKVHALFSSLDDMLYAPDQWQVIEWLRINHGIWISVVPNDNSFSFELFNLKGDKSDEMYIRDESITDYHKSPQIAYSAAFDYILKELI